MHANDSSLMPNLLNDNLPVGPDIAGAMETPTHRAVADSPLQNYGTLFKGFRLQFGADRTQRPAVAVTGSYVDVDLNLREHPQTHHLRILPQAQRSQQTAMNCWWVANQLSPYPALNFQLAGYGPAYGANFIAYRADQSAGLRRAGQSRNFSSNREATIRNMKVSSAASSTIRTPMVPPAS